METEQHIYRLLQQHLDRQAVGFPAAPSGADLKLLKRLFTPEEAKVALSLSYRPISTAEISTSYTAQYAEDVDSADVEKTLNAMFMKGAIGRKERDGASYWYAVPLVVGMFEFQGANLSRGFFKDAMKYMGTRAYQQSFLAVKPSQMRTIPINLAIKAEHHVAPYDQIRAIIEKSHGPFVIVPCICRELKKLQKKPCSKTSRSETCLGFGDMGAMALKRNFGRQISREEALEILSKNEEDGLVFQPAGAQDPEFICSCCGCCCGMLTVQKMLPRPVDFWTSNFYAVVSADLCLGCGECVHRCQVNAVTVSGKNKKAVVNLKRCIGCGLCVSTCTPQAISLHKKNREIVPPENEAALNEEIMRNKKGPWAQRLIMLKVVLGLRQ